MRNALAAVILVMGMFWTTLPVAAQETAPAAPAPAATPPPADAARPRVDVSTYYTNGAYSTGGSSDSLAVYLQYRFGQDSKVWLGHNHIRYSDTQAFVNGTQQDIDNVGAYVALDRKNAVQVDYFLVNTSPGGRGSVAGLEVLHTFAPEITAGLGGAVSSYPGARAWQVGPRVLVWPSPTLSFQSKILVTGASGTAIVGNNTRLAAVEKITWYAAPGWSVRFGGCVGSAWFMVDNDTSTLYTQTQPVVGTFFGGVRYEPSKNAALTLHYERTYFQGYSVEYVLGGVSIRF